MSQLQARGQRTVQTVFFPVSIQRVTGSGATHPPALTGERAEQGRGAQAATERNSQGTCKSDQVSGQGGASPAWE